MEQKTVKNILPTTYEQFVAQRKKQQSKIHPVPNKVVSSIDNTHEKQQKYPKKNLTEYSEQENNDAKETKIIQTVVYSDYKAMFDDFLLNKFDSIKGKIELQLKKLKQQKPAHVLSTNKIMRELGIQSLENINRLEEEMKLAPGKRNLDLIDSMLSFNKFFVILNREKRFKIYDNALFEIAQAGQKIYDEGETDDYMFIVVKGCVKQFEKKQTSFNEKITVNFITHYEGSNFGESLLLNEEGTKAKRYHSAVAAEQSYLLKILNSFYRELITNSKEDDFEKKVNALMSTVIFKDTSKLVIMPLVSTIEKTELDYGKVLIRQGQEVRKLYFVASGNLQVIYLDRSKRNVKHLNIEQKPQNFYLKKPDCQKRPRSKNYGIHSTFYYPSNKESNKEFIYGQKVLDGDELEYTDHILFSDLRIGDFIGGKSFIPKAEIQKRNDLDHTFSTSLQSKLTVVSSSIQTVVYSIDEKKFFSLSDHLQKVIIEGILSTLYFDQYDIDQKVSGQREWKKYSQKLVESVIKNKKQRNHSFRI